MLSKSDKHASIKGKRMTDVFYAQSIFREAFPTRRYGSVKAALYEARRTISRHVRKEFTDRRARSIWEGTARRIDAEEMEALKSALIEENAREAVELRARLAALDEVLALRKADHHRAQMARSVEEMGR